MSKWGALKGKAVLMRRTVLVTPEGNKILEPGELVDQKYEVGAAEPQERIPRKAGSTPKGMEEAYKHGPPLEVIVGGERKFLPRNRQDRKHWGDMDHVLDPEDRRRRVALIKQRMKEEQLG